VLAEEDRGKATATEGVTSGPQFAKKKLSVGAGIVMHGVVEGWNGLFTVLKDPRVQMR
jgi:hypothetical protein